MGQMLQGTFEVRTNQRKIERKRNREKSDNEMKRDETKNMRERAKRETRIHTDHGFLTLYDDGEVLKHLLYSVHILVDL